MTAASPPPVEPGVRALLALVDDYRIKRCGSILGQARAQADVLIGNAHANARAVARRTFDEARKRREVRLAAARAEVATRLRVAEQHRLRALLEEGMRRLHEALLRRWRDPVQRARWIAHVVAEAQRRLPAGTWRVEHPAAFSEAERERLAGTLGSPPEFAAAGDMRAGLRIGVAPNVIDGTLEGILEGRDDVQAQLLAAFARAPRADAQEGTE